FNTGMIQLKAGKVSALAVLTRDRNPALPDVPTLSETVMPCSHTLPWAGMFGPAGMPPEAVKVLADAVQKALDNPEVRKRFAGAGTDVYWRGPQQFAEFVKTELVSWTAMIKEAGIEPECRSHPQIAALAPLNQPPDTPFKAGQFPRLRPWPHLPSAAL